MKKKAEKIQEVEERAKEVASSKTLIFTSFTKLPINELNELRKSLRQINAPFRIIKKRLFKRVLEKQNFDFEYGKEEGQAGIVFSPKDMLETSGVVYSFAKSHDTLAIVGGVDGEEGKLVPAEYVIRLGQLPSREVLLGQLVGMLVFPIRSFLFVLNEKAKQGEGEAS